MIVQVVHTMNVYVEVDTEAGTVVRVVDDVESMQLAGDIGDSWHRNANGDFVEGPTPEVEIDRALLVLAGDAEWPESEAGY